MPKPALDTVNPHVVGPGSTSSRDYLRPDEAAALISAAGRHGRQRLRDKVLLRLMYRHGLRASEARNVRWADIDLDGREHWFRIYRLKGSEATEDRLDRDEVSELRKLREASASPFVFVSERGGPISPDAIARIVASAGIHAGVGMHVHPYMLRHSTGYMMASAGSDTRSIKEFLGHKNIQHAGRYTRLPSTDADIHVGDCLDVLKRFGDNTFDACVTSPPYFFTRDYGLGDDQIGLDASPAVYVDRLVEVFEEVRRVLKPRGTCWISIDDNYCTRRAIRLDGKRTVSRGGKLRSWAESSAAARTITGAQFRDMGIKEKDLFLIPSVLACELRAKGWYVRSKIICVKSSVVSASRTNRPVHAYETVIFMGKRHDCTYNHDAVMEPGAGGIAREGRDVWMFPPGVFRSEHTATMPEELAERCILAGSHAGGRVLDPFAGTGTTGVMARRHGRHVDLIEANPDYAALARRRLDASPRL